MLHSCKRRLQPHSWQHSLHSAAGVPVMPPARYQTCLRRPSCQLAVCQPSMPGSWCSQCSLQDSGPAKCYPRPPHRAGHRRGNPGRPAAAAAADTARPAAGAADGCQRGRGGQHPEAHGAVVAAVVAQAVASRLPARQAAAATTELGVQILSDLQRQRETILHSRDTLHTVDTHVSRSRQILQTMSRRILHNKLIMWGIILLLLGAIGLVLYAKF
ncbi:hypothetical protein ABPG75_006157 [Micractinium tetrahymenae]